MSPSAIRRLALQIAAQLPDAPEDALRVLKCAKEVVEFLRPPRGPGKPAGQLLRWDPTETAPKR
jgi:hypothetical protein